jgi:hypothetical protein
MAAPRMSGVDRHAGRTGRALPGSFFSPWALSSLRARSVHCPAAQYDCADHLPAESHPSPVWLRAVCSRCRKPSCASCGMRPVPMEMPGPCTVLTGVGGTIGFFNDRARPAAIEGQGLSGGANLCRSLSKLEHVRTHRTLSSLTSLVGREDAVGIDGSNETLGESLSRRSQHRCLAVLRPRGQAAPPAPCLLPTPLIHGPDAKVSAGS